MERQFVLISAYDVGEASAIHHALQDMYQFSSDLEQSDRAVMKIANYLTAFRKHVEERAIRHCARVICEAETGKCVQVHDPLRADCTPENCEYVERFSQTKP